MSSSSSSPPPPPWVELPHEIITEIFLKLGAVERIRNISRVCKTWNKIICKAPATWRVIDMLNNNLHNPKLEEKICQHAVDLSQGQLIDIGFEAYSTDDILNFISERSGQLRRLEIVFGYNVCQCFYWGYTLSDACKKFPFLKELHIFYYHRINAECIKSIGNSCPSLTSLKLNNIYCHVFDLGDPKLGDEEALAIASTMPKLSKLEIIGHCMSDEGVTSILNGCVELECIDLGLCRYVTLEGELGIRCTQQIKQLKSPHDNPIDYEYYGYKVPYQPLTESEEESYGISRMGPTDSDMHDEDFDEVMDFMSEDSG